MATKIEKKIKEKRKKKLRKKGIYLNGYTTAVLVFFFVVMGVVIANEIAVSIWGSSIVTPLMGFLYLVSLVGLSLAGAHYSS